MRINRENTTLSNNRWMKYATAGAAGAVAVLGAQTSVDADFTFVEFDPGVFVADGNPGDGYFSAFGPYTFGVGSAGIAVQHAFEFGGPGAMQALSYGSIEIAGTAPVGPMYASNFLEGSAISGGSFGNSTVNGVGSMAWLGSYGNFRQSGTSYVGFRFNFDDVGMTYQYGFLEVIMDGSPENTGTLVGYGWGEAGDAVTAGQRHVPEPGSLGVLALGSVGLLAWRRRRTA